MLNACATPVAPSGGPIDKVPPRVIQTTPEEQALQVDSNTISILFSEYINQSTFQQSFSITPPLSSIPKIRWRGREVTISFAERFRPNTTYVITLDKSLKDFNGVALTSPISWAFSTSNQIDSGKIEGKVIASLKGTPANDVDIFAYKILYPDSLQNLSKLIPTYRTQTGENGVFRFNYLPPDSFFVLAINDKNRNLRTDANELRGLPHKLFIPTSTDSLLEQRTWILGKQDTIPPAVRQVRSMASNKHVIGFTEPILFSDSTLTSWQLTDSLETAMVTLRGLSTNKQNTREIFFYTKPLEQGTYKLSLSNVADSSLNFIYPGDYYFKPRPNADTSLVQTVAFEPNVTGNSLPVVPPNQNPIIVLDNFIDLETLSKAISVTDTLANPLNFSLRTTDGFRHQIVLDWDFGDIIEVQFKGSSPFSVDSVFTQRFQKMPLSQLGSITGKIAYEGKLPLIIELYTANAPNPLKTLTIRDEKEFLFEHLPESTYTLRYFVDENNNGIWNIGNVFPFQPSEPIGWQQSPITVRAGFEHELENPIAFN